MHADVGEGTHMHTDVGEGTHMHADVGEGTHMHTDVGEGAHMYTDVGEGTHMHTDVGEGAHMYTDVGEGTHMHTDVGEGTHMLVMAHAHTDACDRSSASKMRFIELLICMISPLIKHSFLLSSSTVFMDSIHRVSMGPSNTTHLRSSF
jgi:hypothetical protein